VLSTPPLTLGMSLNCVAANVGKTLQLGALSFMMLTERSFPVSVAHCHLARLTLVEANVQSWRVLQVLPVAATVRLE